MRVTGATRSLQQIHGADKSTNAVLVFRSLNHTSNLALVLPFWPVKEIFGGWSSPLNYLQPQGVPLRAHLHQVTISNSSPPSIRYCCSSSQPWSCSPSSSPSLRCSYCTR